jgi:hypothetical protein
VWGLLGFINSTIKKIWKNKTKINSAFEQNRSRRRPFQKPERSDVDEALFKWFKKQRSENVPLSGLLVPLSGLLMIFCSYI